MCKIKIKWKSKVKTKSRFVDKSLFPKQTKTFLAEFNLQNIKKRHLKKISHKDRKAVINNSTGISFLLRIIETTITLLALPIKARAIIIIIRTLKNNKEIKASLRQHKLR
jgi:hypothetical protein